MSAVNKSLFVSIIGRYLFIIINIASVATYARMLTPELLGEFIVASGITALASEVRLLGTGNYLIRKDSVELSDMRAVTGVTMLVSWTLAFLMLISSPFIGDFYEMSSLPVLLAILSIGFFCAPFVAVTSSMLQRDFQFVKLLVVNLSSATVTYGSSVSFLLLGLESVGLALGVMLGQFTQLAIMYWFQREKSGWLPRFVGTIQIIKFGFFIASQSLLKRLTDILPDLILGKTGGASTAAYFSRAQGLVNFSFDFIYGAVSPLLLPYYSKVKREGGGVSDTYLYTSNCLSVFVLPMLAVLSVAAEPAILLMFGDQWSSSIPLVKYICIWGALKVLFAFSLQLLISSEDEKILFYKQLFVSFLYGISILIGYYLDDLRGVSLAMVASAAVDYVITLLVLKRKFELPLVKQLSTHFPAVFIATICTAVTLLLDHLVSFETTSPIAVLGLIAIIITPTWFAILVLIKHPMASFIFENIRKLRARFQG